MIVYGIKNCDTVKKALTWLRDNNIDFEFHDFKKQGIQQEKLKQWADKNGWESFLNKKGTTWKKLDATQQVEVTNEQAAFKLMEEKTSIIKRPVIEKDNVLIFGFDTETYQKKLL